MRQAAQAIRRRVVIAIQLLPEAEPGIERAGRGVVRLDLEAGSRGALPDAPLQECDDRAPRVAATAQCGGGRYRLDHDQRAVEDGKGHGSDPVLDRHGRERPRQQQRIGGAAEGLDRLRVEVVDRPAQREPVLPGRLAEADRRIVRAGQRIDRTKEGAGLTLDAVAALVEGRVQGRRDLRHPEQGRASETGIDRLAGRDRWLGRQRPPHRIGRVDPARSPACGPQQVSVDHQLARARPCVEAGLFHPPDQILMRHGRLLERRGHPTVCAQLPPSVESPVQRGITPA